MTEEPRSDGLSERGIVPIVARQNRALPAWLLMLAAGLAAVLLFAVLNARRNAAEAPAVEPHALDLADLPAAAPTLAIPPEPASAIAPVAPPQPPVLPANIPFGSPLGSAPIVLRSSATPSNPPMIVSSPPAVSPALRPPASGGTAGGSAVVIDNSTPVPANAANGQPTQNGAAGTSPKSLSTTRVHAGMLADRATTVVQGTLIHAVLETGFDSTRPGFARAVVSQDIRGFDGSRVLIPRGSRLIGEYQADVRTGQHRALIIWSRLIRPDGATIEIGSPASDPVGRGGISAEVNNHFFERFSGAILQSALDVGVNLASRSSNSAVVVALPNSGGLTGSIVQPTNVTPTLKVKPATSVSVFVARDLDFTEVENRP